jgi:hypothetical protein
MQTGSAIALVVVMILSHRITAMRFWTGCGVLISAAVGVLGLIMARMRRPPL